MDKRTAMLLAAAMLAADVMPPKSLRHPPHDGQRCACGKGTLRHHPDRGVSYCPKCGRLYRHCKPPETA